MRKIFKRLLRLICFFLIIVILIGIFYFIYINIKEEADIKTSGTLSINYTNGSKIKVSKTKTVKFSVINSSEEEAFYYIEFKNLKNIKGNIKYNLSNDKDINIIDNLNSYNTIISSYISIQGGETQNYTLVLDSKDNIKYSLELSVNMENLETNTFAEVILNNNEIKEKPLTNPGTSIATTDEGLIKGIDDYGITYYFRGKVLNNNVLIENNNYKIVRINGDGSVKLVLDGITDSLKKYYENATDYTYKNSIINTYLNNDWLNKALSKSLFYIANQKYCNDINIKNNNFLALSRIKIDNIPSFVCLGDKIASKVGLLTVDEAIYAGATLNEDNKDFYLYNENIATNYYLMTSANIDDTTYYPFVLSSNGKVLSNEKGSSFHGVRPVITIIKTATVSGSGTVNDPYVLT